VIQGSERSGFLLEPAKAFGRAAEFLRQNFDRHVTAEARIPRAKHFSHSTRADGGHDLERTKFGAGVQQGKLWEIHAAWQLRSSTQANHSAPGLMSLQRPQLDVFEPARAAVVLQAGVAFARMIL
jgi:hypothetical protein